MKKVFSLLLIIFLGIALLGCSNAGNRLQSNSELNPNTAAKNQENAELTITNLVQAFGGSLQNVSLQAPPDVLKKSMQDNYGEFVTPDLLEKWQKDPLNAPGRFTSSPWPDRIEIRSLKQLDENTYQIEGEIVEITSTEKPGSGAAAKRPLTLVVKKNKEHWLISTASLGNYETVARSGDENPIKNGNDEKGPDSKEVRGSDKEEQSAAAEDLPAIIYDNSTYGFRFVLPASWQGYAIIDGKWEGLSVEGSGQEAVETGPLLSIRHPRWTAEKQRQDIPLLVFTLKQWQDLQEEKFHIGAAPIGPKELGRNDKYVFALPARYNYAFPAGYEEVEDILGSQPLQAY